MQTTAPRFGIVIFAHGSRDPLWSLPMQTVEKLIRQQAPESLVACAYLELMTPSLQDCVVQMSAQGVTSVRVVPLFLGVGKHVREDLPKLIAAIAQDYPGVKVTLAPSIGEDPRVLQLMADIATEHP